MRKSEPVFDPRRRALLRGAAELGIAATGGLLVRPTQAAALQIGQPAPPLVLHAVDGRSIATQDLLGQVVIITFWATWCVPCREELPLLSAYASAHARQDLKVLGFSLDGADAMPKVREVAASMDFPVGLLGSSYAGGYGRIWRIPVSFVIDRAGRLAHNGWNDAEQPWTTERLQTIVEPLLARLP